MKHLLNPGVRSVRAMSDWKIEVTQEERLKHGLMFGEDIWIFDKDYGYRMGNFCIEKDAGYCIAGAEVQLREMGDMIAWMPITPLSELKKFNGDNDE